MLLAAVLVPSSNLSLLSGLPLTSLGELTALLIISPFVASGALREDLSTALRRLHPRASAITVGVAVLALALKVTLLASGTHGGFRACYRSITQPPEGRCEQSYDNPFSRFGGITRLDRALDFGSRNEEPPEAVDKTDWRLGFLNTLRFNFFETGQPIRTRLPFEVEWRGTIKQSEQRTATIKYAGEGIIEIGGRQERLAPSYDSISDRHLNLPSGTNEMVVRYSFNHAPPEIGSPQEPQPYATFRLLADGTSITTAAAPWSWRLLGWTADTAVVSLLLLLVWVIALRLFPLARPLGTIGAGLFVAFYVGYPWSAVIIVLAAYFYFVSRPESEGIVTPVLGAYVAFVSFSLARGIGDSSSFEELIYRGGGHDFLTYEGFARSILATGSLQAGEEVFVYQPGFRYLLFLGRALFGEGDPPLFIGALLALIFAVFLPARLLYLQAGDQPRVRRKMNSKRSTSSAPIEALPARGIAITSVGAVLLAIVISPATMHMLIDPVSEYPTWIFLLLGTAALFLSPSRTMWTVGCGLLGLAFVTRMNQLPGLLALLALASVYLMRRADLKQGERLRTLALGIGTFVGLALLPALHNFYYGGELAVLARTPDLPVNFPLPPSDLISVFSDDAVRKTLFDQLAGVFHINASFIWYSDPWLEGMIHLIQLAWLGVAGAVIWTWKQRTVLARMTIFLPLAFLIPHIFVQVYVYYPRHIIAGHLAMGASILLTLAAWKRPDLALQEG